MNIGLVVLILVIYFIIGILYAASDHYNRGAGHIVWWPIYALKFLYRSFWEALRD